MQESSQPATPAQALQSWSSSLWRWQPSDGRWSADRFSLPRVALFLSLSTKQERPRDRFDFWRHIALYDFDAHPRRYSASEGFQASVSGLVGPNASLFTYQCDELLGDRTSAGAGQDGWDDVTVGLLVNGQRRHAEGDDRYITSPGQFFGYDAGRDSTVHLTKGKGIILGLRRQALEAAFGGKMPSSADLAKTVARSPLSPFLSSQMRLLAELAGSLDDIDRASMLQNTVDLLAMALRVTGAPERDEEEHGPRRLLSAALNVIEINLSNPLLDPDMLATALGCSRAKLYRAFSEYGLTIAGVIREMRLKQARAMIETLPPEVPIADIGMRCGFLDAANFSRNFRVYFGASPTEFRRQG